MDQTADLYNAARRAGSGPRDGFRHTEESKRKMSEHGGHSKGTKLSAAHIEKIRIASTGRPQPESKRIKLSRALKGRVITWGAKISATKTGVPMSPEARANWDLANVRRGEAISRGKLGKPWSDARRAAHESRTLKPLE